MRKSGVRCRGAEAGHDGAGTRGQVLYTVALDVADRSRDALTAPEWAVHDDQAIAGIAACNCNFQLPHSFLHTVYQLLDVVLGHRTSVEGASGSVQVGHTGQAEKATADLESPDYRSPVTPDHPTRKGRAESLTGVPVRTGDPDPRVDATNSVDEVDVRRSPHILRRNEWTPLGFGQLRRRIHLRRRDLVLVHFDRGAVLRRPAFDREAGNATLLHVSTRSTEEELPTFLTRYWIGIRFASSATCVTSPTIRSAPS